MIKTCQIRLKSTGAVLTVKSYGNGWITAKGDFIHRTQAELVNSKGDM